MTIILRGLSEHNLKAIDLALPKGQFITVVGPSGAGKSTLVFDTLHAESEARYIETFSPYVRQFLERRARPKARLISNLPASILIATGNPVRNARSTVATLAEISYPVRHLFYRASTLVCPRCNIEVEDQGPGDVLDFFHGLSSRYSKGVFIIAFKGSKTAFQDLRARGFVRCIIGGRLCPIEDVEEGRVKVGPEEVPYIVLDRLRLEGVQRGDVGFEGLDERLREAVELGFIEGGDTVFTFLLGKDGSVIEGPKAFTRGRRCPRCRTRFSPPTLALFSFNSPHGACPKCQGFGRITAIDRDMIVPDPSRSIEDGAIVPLERWGYEKGLLIEYLRAQGIDPSTPWKDLPQEIREAVFTGHGKWPGIDAIFKELEEYRYKAHIRILLARYRSYVECPECHGTRFRQDALNYRINGASIADFYGMTIEKARMWLRESAHVFASDRATLSLYEELRRRVETLFEAGLGYITLSRQARTLSGGELSRVAMSKAIGSNLTETLYCVDEPTRGLHPRDSKRIKGLLRAIVKRGNTVIAVTHEPDIIFSSDTVVALGPGSGKDGGRVTYIGPPRGDVPGLAPYRRCVEMAALPHGHPSGHSKKGYIEIKGATCHNLRSISVRFPKEALTVVTGVSGSGKSSLVEYVLYRGVLRALGKATDAPGPFRVLEGIQGIEDVVLVDQSRLSKTPRATVATYSGALLEIRAIYAQTPGAKALGLSPGNFSFNSQVGRCPACKGLGVEVMDMQFLPDVHITCPMCKGTRLRPDVRGVSYRGLRFDDALGMTVEEARDFFEGSQGICSILTVLLRLGLGHLRLDQALNTLSGGEAQRLKLSRAFSKGRTRGTLFILDEPARSLHPSEVGHVAEAIRSLVERGASVVAVEHNPIFTAFSDWIIELGPGGGEDGGRVVFQGPPEKAMCGRDDQGVIKVACQTRPETSTPLSMGPSKALQGYISIKGARHHNLRDISIEIPRDRFVVITGPSGSGKSTLAFDIIHSEGERRYIEALPSYMRGFLKLYERPDVDEISGLSPSVAIEQRKAASGSMSTVATLTEVAHYLRLLYARASKARCPGCGTVLEAVPRDRIADEIRSRFRGKELYLLAPRVRKRKGYFRDILQHARQAGACLVMVDGRFYPVTDLPYLDRFKEHSISWVFGPVAPSGRVFPRLLETCLYYGGGEVEVRGKEEEVQAFFSERRSCVRCGISLPDPDPLLFSFNTKDGRCPRCKGTGRPGKDVCPECSGSRLSSRARSYTIDGVDMGALMGLEVSEAMCLLGEWLERRPWEKRLHAVAEGLLGEVISRLGFLEEVGLGYLTLSRSGDTLSGGEAQRIRLAAQIGSGLSGLTIVLDEPTIGLHPLDNRRLLNVFKRLRDQGNTVIVVEHDEETIRSADWLVDLGPGGGKDGGLVVAQGTPEEVERRAQGLTARALEKRSKSGGIRPTGAHLVDVRQSGAIRLQGVSIHNIEGQDIEVPLGRLTCIIGVSGSGKSTLLEDVLYQNLLEITGKGRGKKETRGPIHCREFLVEGAEVKRVALVDSSPIGRTPRSCVITYLGLYTPIRELFSSTALSRARGYRASTFSFNVEGGRCPTCKGQGVEEVRLGFLPPVFVPCPACQGRRFTPDVLQVKWAGKNIFHCLTMTVDEAITFFGAHPRLRHGFEVLRDLGLGYLELGQRSPTLSGGEAQRLKLSKELMGRAPEGVVYLLDEPTTGLHMEDVERLMTFLHGLVALGNTVVIVEHNLDVIMNAHHVVELGPGGGRLGGRVVFQGGIEAFLAQDVKTPTRSVLSQK